MGIKHFAAAATLSVALCAAPTVVAYADEGVDNSPPKDDPQIENLSAEKINNIPEVPKIENLPTEEANKLITNYNIEVDKYNKNVEDEYYNQLTEATVYNESVDKHNTQVDLDYEQALQENEKQNSEIMNHNISEEQRIATETAINEQRQQEADARNAEIDAENAAAEQAAKEAAERNAQKIAEKKEYDAQVDANYEAAIAAENQRVINAKAAEDARIKQIKIDNIEKQKQYDAELKQYKKDKEFEDKILAAKDANGNQRYVSVQDYNDYIDYYNEQITNYNVSVENINAANGISTEDANNSAEYNKNATPFDINLSYKIINGEKSNTPARKVHLTHTFVGTSQVYSTLFEINNNDTLILYPAGTQLDTFNEKGAQFFFYDENYEGRLGYWYSTYSEFGTTAYNYTHEWNHGDVHIVTYKDGVKNGDNDIYMDYYYAFYPLYKTLGYYSHANIPNKPAEIELEDETPHYITPNEITRGEYMVIELEDETYNPISHIIPELINAVPADIWQLIDRPIKGDYLSYMPYPDYPVLLAHMNYLVPNDLIPAPDNPTPDNLVPTDDPIPNNNPTPANNDPIPSNNPVPANNPIEVQVIEENSIPLIELPGNEETYVENNDNGVSLNRLIGIEQAYADTVDDNDNPLNSGQDQTQQAWALVNLILMFITILILVKVPRKKENNQTDKYYYKHHNNIVGILLATAAVILFILTENIWLPMVMVDPWTIWMALICGGGVVARFFSRTTKEKIEE